MNTAQTPRLYEQANHVILNHLEGKCSLLFLGVRYLRGERWFTENREAELSLPAAF